jgi:hypothetical protein
VASYTDGEFDITRERQDGSWTYTDTYFYGGVDLTNLVLDRLGRHEVEQRHPDLVRTVQASLDQSATDGEGQRWLGAAVTPAPAPDALPPPAPATGPDDPFLPVDADAALITLFSLGIVICLTLMHHLLRERRRAGPGRRPG